MAFAPSSIVSKTATVMPRNVGIFMSGEEKGQDGKLLKSVLSKEIIFDDKTGRFFETTLGDGDDDTSVENDVSSPFRSNPFKKPEGTFFDELFAKKDEDTVPVKEVSVEDANVITSEKEPASFFDMFKKPEESPISQGVPQEVTTFFDNFFKPKPQVPAEPEPIKFDPVTISPDFRVAGAFLLAAYVLDNIPVIQFTLGPIVTLLGLLFLVQTLRVRFVFNEDNQIEVRSLKNPLTGELQSSGENFAVGGANIWSCDTIVNYDFFPAIDSSPVGPILVYFKETQTDSEFWSQGYVAFARLIVYAFFFLCRGDSWLKTPSAFLI